MASSKIQSLLVAELVGILYNPLRRFFRIGTNEAGLKFDKSDWRAADIGLWDRKKEITLDNKYFDIMPEIVIEVDTKADEEIDNYTYVSEKTKHLHHNGVKKVIWIFTATEQVMIAEVGKRWEIADWSEDVVIAGDFSINIKAIVEDIMADKND
jgi:Uma2 family endonuclease